MRRTLVAVVKLMNTREADGYTYKQILSTIRQFIGEKVLTADLLTHALRQYDSAEGSEP